MDTAMSTPQRNMTPSELMALVPSSAPAGLKLNWNKTAGKWYYYISSYSYDPHKKRSVESRGTTTSQAIAMTRIKNVPLRAALW